MSEVTIERLERGLALLAYCIELDGPVVVPLFERLERELEAMRRQQDTVARAKRLLETCSGPRLSLAPPLASEDKSDAGVHSTAPQPYRFQ
jgi:hypothetical protein